MIASEPARRISWSDPSLGLVLAALAALTAIRIVGLRYSVVDLFFDEAQYWAWSRELAFGYFSKPPLLAWIIAAFDPLCGSGEACVRAASPVIYFVTCFVIYAIANGLYGRRVAAWSALTFALGTGLTFSSRIISTDVPLILFWAVALLAYVRLLPSPDWRWSVALGVALGLGLLAKYAMVYFVLCAICAAAFDRDARALLARPQTWVALAIAFVIVAPNLFWNMANHFVTFRHTGDNITGDGLRLQPLQALGFVGSQFGVAGPLIFAGFVVILVRMWREPVSREDRLMLAFAIPPLALVATLSLVRGANANWAAVSILSMHLLVVAWWLRDGLWSWLKATLAIGLIVQALLLVGDAYADRLTVAALGSKRDLYRRTLGSRELGQQAAWLARAAHAPTVAAEGRAAVAGLIYYLRNDPVRALSWPISAIPDHQFDLTRALDNSAEEPVVFISYCPFGSRLGRFYQDVTPLGPVVVSTGPTTRNEWHAFRLAKRQRPIEPLGPCAPP